MWGLDNEINRMPARITDGGGGVVATVGTGEQERVTLLDPTKDDVFFQDGPNAIIQGTEEGFTLYQLDGKGEKQALQPVGPSKRIKAVRLIHGLTAEGIILV